MSLRFHVTLRMVGIPTNRRRTNVTRERAELRINRNGCFLDLEEDQFKLQIRLSKASFHDLCGRLRNHIPIGTTRRAVSLQLKIFTALRFLAQGGYQLSVGNDYNVGVAQPTVSVVLNEVVEAINAVVCPEFITVPSITRMKQSALHFQEKYRIPGVFGMVDGTHISIVGPTGDPQHPEFIYVNRKHFHSLNVQVICNEDYRIFNVNAKFPGSTHDSFVWKRSKIRQYLSTALTGNDLWLLGDSGYPLEPWLMVPYKPPSTPGEELFNNFHATCRSTVERCIGVLKARWRCLKLERGLHYKPVTASKIVNACVALHNMCIDSDPNYCHVSEIEIEQSIDDGVFNNVHESLYIQGNAIRDSLIEYVL